VTLSPARALALSLAAAGAALLWLNRVEPDESRMLGAAVLLVAVVALAARETPGRARVLEAVAVLLLVLAGGEWAVRRENGIAARAYAERLMHFVDDPLLRYEMQPEVACGVGTTNPLGMLDGPREAANPHRALRVACLGDSVGGDCSLPQDNACAALERVLRDARGGRPTEVLNFSVPGYNTMQEARALEVKAAPFAPDVVVVLYVVNDPYPDLAISHFLPGKLKFQHLLYSGLRVAAWRIFGSAIDPFGGMLTQFFETPRAWDDVVVAGFERIRAFAAAKDLPVVVAVFPLFIDKPLPDHLAVYPRVVSEAERHGFIGVNLAEAAYRDEPLAALLKPSRDMIHPNAHAHELAAQAIARALLAARPELATR
jgi:lysophospholipase L1-like esterase